MSLILTESFEQNNLFQSEKWYNTGVIGGGNARTGTFHGQNPWYRRLNPSEEDATLIAGIALFNPVTQTQPLEFRSDNVTTIHVTITIESDGSLKVFRGTVASGTLIGQSSPGAFHLGAGYVYLEAKVTLGASGSVILRTDETVVLSLVGVNTKNGGIKTVLDSVGYNVVNFNVIDDVYLCNTAGSVNNDFLGAVHIECLTPNGNGTWSQGTNDAGNSTNNYSHMNFSVGSHYVDELATGSEDTFTFTDSSYPTSTSVFGVMQYCYAEKTDANPRGLSLVARSGGVETQLPIMGPPNSPFAGSLANGTYHEYSVVYESKPGGGAWTVADVNAAEFGFIAT